MKKYYVWTGNNNATFGTPNKTTGCYTTYGYTRAFPTKWEALQECDVYSEKHNTYPVLLSKADLRSKYLGISVAMFTEFVLNLCFYECD
jgi:hypothetical protein